MPNDVSSSRSASMSQIIFMKKAFKSLLCVVIMLSIAISTFVQAGAASQKSSVFSYLTKDMGLSEAAACGIMANIEKESNFDPTIVARDSNGKLSGGLCMWNGSRFTSLRNYCNNNGYNYLSVKGQLSYLKHELKTNYYKHIYDYLKKVPNTAQGAYDAAYYWCYYFEIPQNRSSKAVSRGNLAKNTYWKAYDPTLKNFSLSCTDNKKDVDITKTEKLSWKSAGKAAKSYTVYLAKVKDGKADYNNAKKIKLSADTLSHKLNLSQLGKGTYSAYVLAKSSSKSLKSNTVTFTVKCLNHAYTSVVSKNADKANDLRTYTCKNCKETIKKTISSKAQSVAPSVKAFGVTSCKKDSVSFKLSLPKEVSGFECYKWNGEKWIKVNTLPAEKGSVTIKGLSSGKVYKFRFRAFTDTKEKTLFSEYKTISVPTATEKVKLTSVTRPQKGTIGLSWEKVPGADSYEIFISGSEKGEYKRAKTVNGSTLTCKITDLKGSTKYFVKVRAVNKSDSLSAYSAFSNIKSAVTL